MDCASWWRSGRSVCSGRLGQCAKRGCQTARHPKFHSEMRSTPVPWAATRYKRYRRYTPENSLGLFNSGSYHVGAYLRSASGSLGALRSIVVAAGRGVFPGLGRSSTTNMGRASQKYGLRAGLVNFPHSDNAVYQESGGEILPKCTAKKKRAAISRPSLFRLRSSAMLTCQSGKRYPQKYVHCSV